MNIFRKIKSAFRLIYDSDFRFIYFQGKGIYNKMSDEKYLKKAHKVYLHKELDLINPKTFNEKLQWLKLYDRNPDYRKMVDKAEVKKYISEVIGEEVIIPTIGIWNNFDEIKFEELPEQFVLKCTHDSGDPIVCRNKSELDLRKVKKYFKKYLKRNYYYYAREWTYKDLQPRIIAEKYMSDKGRENESLTDYKFFCFNGKPKYVYTVKDREKGYEKSLHRFYDINWNLQNVDLDHRGDQYEAESKPETLDKMIEIATILSKNIKFVRVDLYQCNGKVYFGELTFYPRAGWEPFEPECWDYLLGEELDLNL